MSITHALFGFFVRGTRFHFWMGHVAIAALLIILFVAGLSSFYAMKSAGTVRELFGAMGFMLLVVLGILVVLTWVSWAVAIKRLHDRNKSWVWLFITLIPTVMLLWSAGTSGLKGMHEFQSSALFVTVQILVWGWYLIDLGFMPGTPGGNLWGPQPGGTGGTLTSLDDFFPAETAVSDRSKAQIPAVVVAPGAVAASRRATDMRPQRVGAVVRHTGTFGRRNAPA